MVVVETRGEGHQCPPLSRFSSAGRSGLPPRASGPSWVLQALSAKVHLLAWQEGRKRHRGDREGHHAHCCIMGKEDGAGWDCPVRTNESLLKMWRRWIVFSRLLNILLHSSSRIPERSRPSSQLWILHHCTCVRLPQHARVCEYVRACVCVWVMKPGEHLVGNLFYFTRVSPSSLPALLTHMWKVLKAPLRKFVSRLSSQSLSSRIRPLSFCCFPGEQVLLLRVKDPTFLSSSLAFDWRFSALISEGYGFRPSSPHLWQFSPGAPDPPKAHKRDHETDWRL